MNESTTTNEICITVGGLQKLISLIDRIRKKNEKDAIHHLCCKELKSTNPAMNQIISRHYKNPTNLEIKKQVCGHEDYVALRSTWDNEKLHQLINAKQQCLEYKWMGQRLSDDKIEEIKTENPEFMEIVNDFSFLFSKTTIAAV